MFHFVQWYVLIEASQYHDEKRFNAQRISSKYLIFDNERWPTTLKEKRGKSRRKKLKRAGEEARREEKDKESRLDRRRRGRG
jgi:hypothetical protein